MKTEHDAPLSRANQNGKRVAEIGKQNRCLVNLPSSPFTYTGNAFSPPSGSITLVDVNIVLPGDFNGDGLVTEANVTGINNATVGNYNVFAYIIGVGTITVSNVLAARS